MFGLRLKVDKQIHHLLDLVEQSFHDPHSVMRQLENITSQPDFVVIAFQVLGSNTRISTNVMFWIISAVYRKVNPSRFPPNDKVFQLIRRDLDQPLLVRKYCSLLVKRVVALETDYVEIPSVIRLVFYESLVDEIRDISDRKKDVLSGLWEDHILQWVTDEPSFEKIEVCCGLVSLISFDKALSSKLLFAMFRHFEALKENVGLALAEWIPQIPNEKLFGEVAKVALQHESVEALVALALDERQKKPDEKIYLMLLKHTSDGNEKVLPVWERKKDLPASLQIAAFEALLQGMTKNISCCTFVVSDIFWRQPQVFARKLLDKTVPNSCYDSALKVTAKIGKRRARDLDPKFCSAMVDRALDLPVCEEACHVLSLFATLQNCDKCFAYFTAKGGMQTSPKQFFLFVQRFPKLLAPHVKQMRPTNEYFAAAMCTALSNDANLIYAIVSPFVEKANRQSKKCLSLIFQQSCCSATLSEVLVKSNLWNKMARSFELESFW